MAANLTENDVRRVAALAHLSLTDAEVALFVRQLGGILEWAAAIQTADTTGVAPWAGAHGPAPAALRDDTTVDAHVGRTALERAPDANPAAGLFRVPAVL